MTYPFQHWHFKVVLFRTIECFNIYKLIGDVSEPYCYVVHNTINDVSKHLLDWKQAQEYILKQAQLMDNQSQKSQLTVADDSPPW